MSRLGLAVALVLATAGTAAAQDIEITPDFDADPFVVTSDPTSVALTESASPLEARTLAVGLALRVGGPPLHVCRRDPGVDGCALEGDLVSDRFASDLTAAYGFGRFGIHAQLPIVLHQGSDFDPATGQEGLGSAGLGDLRVGGKAWLLRAGGVTLGWDLSLKLPTSGGDDFMGSPGVSIENRALVDWRRDRIRAGASLGYAWRSHDASVADLYVNDELLWTVGGEYELQPDKLSAGLALLGRVGVVSPDAMTSMDGIGGEEMPVEALASGRYWLTRALAVEAALGTGFGDGYSAPSYRVLAGVRWVKHPAVKHAAVIPTPEPEPDPEPDPVVDNDPDKDGVLDPFDVCPQDPEDLDQVADDDGCPETDADQDGLPDEVDQCKTDPEDLDKLLDEDGCPETDADSDAIADEVDQCPLEAEVVNNNADDDGCPDQGLVTITESSIEISDKIFFDLDKASIKKKSFKILDAVASLLKAYDTLVVEVQGHTDDQGTDARNTELSQSRAEAVRDYLIKKGVAAERLTAVGYGFSRPLVEGTTDKARSKNRRVEFVIVGSATEPPAR